MATLSAFLQWLPDSVLWNSDREGAMEAFGLSEEQKVLIRDGLATNDLSGVQAVIAQENPPKNHVLYWVK
jgi:hypothetical protein